MLLPSALLAIFAVQIQCAKPDSLFNDDDLKPLNPPLVVFNPSFITEKQLEMVLLNKMMPNEDYYNITNAKNQESIFQISNPKQVTRSLRELNGNMIGTLKIRSPTVHYLYNGTNPVPIATLRRRVYPFRVVLTIKITKPDSDETTKLSIVQQFGWKSGAKIYIINESGKRVLIAKFIHVIVKPESFMTQNKLWTGKPNYIISMVKGVDSAFITLIAASFISYKQ